VELRHAGLRATRQRIQLSSILFAKGNRHLSAEDLHAEAETAGVHVSLATVYNALHQFTEAGCCARLPWMAAAPISTPISAIITTSLSRTKGN
jgi:Fe2+ or Zn2+ uptake regulation protein